MEENIPSTQEMISIPKDEYDELLEDQLMLRALEHGGVDNWEWYGEAQDLFREWQAEDAAKREAK